MITFHTLDVFTTTPFAGNPLAVVLGAKDPVSYTHLTLPTSDLV